ncbi:MAG: Ig domain-containing protein, partial [Clostridiales bacterium]|nr:Ig domain-containing protein [Clostridiales bacterium]
MRKSETTTKESIRESVRSIRYMSLIICLVLVIGMIGILRDAVRADSSASKEQTSLVADEYSIQGVCYRTQVQDIGWQDYVGNGESAGTIGQSKRLEAIQIKLQGIPGSIEYRTHVQDAGWQEWAANDSVSGTVGMCKRLEAIEIRLTGEAEEAYDVFYRVHAQNVGWMGWAQNGAAAGTAGYSCRLEAIEIRLVPKGEAAPGSADGCFIERYASVIAVHYRTHVQDIGWQDYVENGEVAGTIGQARRLEGIQIKLQNAMGGIEYCTHIQDIGWTNYVSNDAMSGTSGQSKHLEAIKIRLTEPAAKVYDVYYRVHAQNFGWLGWTENGNPAGTTGYSYRLEAIEIRLVEKGAEAPGKTIRAFVE